MTLLAYTVALVVFFIALGAIFYQVRLGRHRGISREAFVAEFQKANIPPEIPGAVYDYYKSQVWSRKFALNSDDSCEKVFREAHEDIDDDAEELVQLLGMEMPTESALREWTTPLQSLRDMVHWLHFVSQHQQTGNLR